MLREGKITTICSNKRIVCQKKIISLESPLVMGILNLTQDSFYDGGKYTTVCKALNRVEEIVEQGGDIIDIGACSTRPGAKLTTAKEEIERILPVLKETRKLFPECIISIDTVWSDVCKAAKDNGADIINDISGGSFDANLFKTVGELNMPYILMHTPTTPDKMQISPHYDNIFMEISKYFCERLDLLLHAGVKDIILDLGFGFGKTIEHNYELLSRQKEFEIFNRPILTGISRKSMIYKPLNITPDKALNGTTFLHAFALANGADILRVHDVAAAKECVNLYKLYKR